LLGLAWARPDRPSLNYLPVTLAKFVGGNGVHRHAFTARTVYPSAMVLPLKHELKRLERELAAELGAR